MTTTVQLSTAVGYFRVSTADQAGERHVSLEVQESAFRGYCHQCGLTPSAVFSDVASGRKDNRPQYQAMLRYIVEHGIGHVVVLFLDRFGRNPREILRRYWELEERGVRVVSVNEDLKEELLLLVRAGIAGAESKRTGERVKAALSRAAQKGVHVGRTPFGYIKVREGNTERWEQVPEEARAIRLMYRLAVDENKGLKLIADELNCQGFRGKAERGASLWAREKVRYVLRNPAMAGQMRLGSGEVIEGVYPAILTPEEWGKLQERLRIRQEGKHRGRTDVSDYLLSGIARCGECKGAMVGHKGGRIRHYICATHGRAAAMCSVGTTHRKELLEKAVLEFIGQYSDPDKVRELLQAQDTVSDNRQEQELARATARLLELERAFLSDLDRVDRGVLNESEYIKRQTARRTEQAALETRKSELEAIVKREKDSQARAERIPVVIGSFFEDFSKMDVRQAKAELQGILKAVFVFPDKRLEVEFRE